LLLPRKPGARKSNSDHSSPRWFCSGVPDRQPLPRLQLAHQPRRPGRRVLDHLRLVQHQQVPFLRGQDGVVAGQQRIGGQHHVMRGDFGEAVLAGGAV